VCTGITITVCHHGQYVEFVAAQYVIVCTDLFFCLNAEHGI